MIHNVTSSMRLINQGMREWGIGLHGTGKTIFEAKQDISCGYEFPQIVYMSCGYRISFESVDSIPDRNIPCECGNKRHWIVRYDIIKQPIYRRVEQFILRFFRGKNG